MARILVSPAPAPSLEVILPGARLSSDEEASVLAAGGCIVDDTANAKVASIATIAQRRQLDGQHDSLVWMMIAVAIFAGVKPAASSVSRVLCNRVRGPNGERFPGDTLTGTDLTQAEAAGGVTVDSTTTIARGVTQCLKMRARGEYDGLETVMISALIGDYFARQYGASDYLNVPQTQSGRLVSSIRLRNATRMKAGTLVPTELISEVRECGGVIWPQTGDDFIEAAASNIFTDDRGQMANNANVDDMKMLSAVVRTLVDDGAFNVVFDTPTTGLGIGGVTIPHGGSYVQAAGANQTTETVKTSAATVHGATFVANTPRHGWAPTGKTGLVIEEARQNRFLSSNAHDAAQWSKESAAVTVTGDAGTAPDGSATADGLAWTATALRYILQTVNFNIESSTISTWLKATSGTMRLRLPSQVGVSNVDSSPFTPGATWAQYAFTQANATTSGSSTALIENDSGFSALVGGQVWGSQLESGKFATELMPSGGGALVSRAAAYVRFSTARIIRNGRIRLRMSFTPKGAATDYGSNFRLWTIDANNYAEVNASTQILTVVVNGNARTATVGLTWKPTEVVEMSFEVGNGSLRVRYRKSNDGVTFGLPFDPYAGAAITDAAISTVSSTFDIFANGASSTFSAWWHQGQRMEIVPSWVLTWLPTDDSAVKAWFRADGHVTLNGSAVSAWGSQVAGPSISQGTGAFQPTFGGALVNNRPGIDFDGSNDSLAVSGLTISAGDLMVSAAMNIVATLGTDTGAILFDSLSGRAIAAIRALATTDNLGYFDNVSWRSSGVAPVTGVQVLTYDMRTSPGGRIYKDGVLQGSAQTYSAVGISGQTAIGSSYNNTGSWMRVRLGDIVIAASQTDALRANLHAFYAAKYGITVV